MPLDIKVEIERLRSMYVSDISGRTYNSLWLGATGSGKTDAILSTCRKPVLIHSFDPGGTRLGRIEHLKKSGDIIVDESFESDPDVMRASILGKKPSTTIYKRFENEFDRLRMGGFFEHMGTYLIDSATNLIHALKKEVARLNGKENTVLSQPDWQIVGNTFSDIVRFCTALPCDFIMTGHLKVTKDDVEGKMFARFNIIPSLQIDLPSLFDEIYVLETVETARGIQRNLITAPTGKYDARTRLGSGKFSLREKPDIRYLLEKAGVVDKDNE